MRVWQPGSSLVSQRKVVVDDWSWAATKRRLTALYRLAHPYRLRTACAIGSLVAATAASLSAPPALIGLAVTDVKEGDTGPLTWIVVAFVVASIVGVVCSYAQTYFTGWTGERMLADLRNHLFRHLQRLSLGFYERNRAGVLISRITNDVEALDQPRHRRRHLAAPEHPHAPRCRRDPVPFLVEARARDAHRDSAARGRDGDLSQEVGSRSYRLVRETNSGAVTATLAEDIAGIRVLQSFTPRAGRARPVRGGRGGLPAQQSGDGDPERALLPVRRLPRLERDRDHPRLRRLPRLRRAGEDRCSGHVPRLLDEGGFFDPVQQLSQLYSTFLSAVAALDKIMEVLVEEVQVRDEPGAPELPRVRGQVRFDSVRFGYGTGPEVLHGIDLDVAAGTTVALVGHTGAGKSTIAKLIARFYDPTEGAITVDGTDLRQVRQESLRRQLGIVPQEGFLFAGTVAENIAFGRPAVAREEIVAAARAVGADEFVDRLEDGYDTELGERGFRLSLGQRQLIAFARALLADPRILILDEATSSVDIAPEQRVERALRRLLHGRTSFVIAHRLSTVRGANLIVVLEHGLVVEQGSHDELLAREGRYAELYGMWVAEAEVA